MKGITTIELTNEKTGEKKTYKEENMITNLYRDLCLTNLFPILPVPYVDVFLLSNYNGDLKKNLFGGLVLFDKTLSTDADDYLMPSDINMIGRGYSIANSSKDLTLGSYNSGSSVITDNKMSMVWDFNTSQAVGTINSICLVPTETAFIGFGKTDTALTNSGSLTTGFYANPCNIPAGFYALLQKGCPYYKYFDFENNCFYTTKVSFSSIHVQKFFLPHTVRSIEKWSCESLSLLDEKEITYPSEIQELATSSTAQRIGCNMMANKLFVTFYYYDDKIPSDGNIYVYILELNNSQFKLKTIKNTTGYDLESTRIITDKYIAFPAKDNNKYIYFVLNIDTGEFSRLKFNNEEVDFWRTNYRVFIVNSDIVVSDLYFGNDSKSAALMFDLSTATVKVLNVANNNLPNHYDSYYPIDKKGLFLCPYYNGSSSYEQIIINPFVLSTKNNLSTPIVKTSEQSMKITYELIKE